MISQASRERLIVALDVEDVATARALTQKLGDTVTFYKIGMELAYCGGLDLARDLKAQGKKIFIDLKLHDIGATVERATRQIARLDADFLTVHAYPQTMTAARTGAGASRIDATGKFSSRWVLPEPVSAMSIMSPREPQLRGGNPPEWRSPTAAR